jgi:hypothetical protein
MSRAEGYMDFEMRSLKNKTAQESVTTRPASPERQAETVAPKKAKPRPNRALSNRSWPGSSPMVMP